MSFTKSTTNISVHQALSDYPNVEDGLSAEQLKERFDFPAETLQDDLNDHIDELEASTAAASVGAASLGTGDTSESNVQAKLGYLQTEIEGVSQGAVADGSITEAKLDSTFNGTIAKKSGTLQTGLNSEMLGGYTLQQVLAYVKPEIGSYTGDGINAGKEINLGFTPSAVIVIQKALSGTITTKYFGVAFVDAPYMTEGIAIIENGFKVKSSGITGDYDFNANNKVYNYIAFK